MNIFNMETVTCSRCGLDAQWEQWIDIPQVHFSEEIIKCKYCGHTDLLAKGRQAYERYREMVDAGAPREVRDEPRGMIDDEDSHGETHSPANPTVRPGSEGVTEFSKWLDTLPPLD